MLLSEKQALFSQDVAKLILHIFDNGYLCSLGEVYRTPEQAKIYAQKGKGILGSLHCKRLAIDINLFDKNHNYISSEEEYRPFGEYWESLSGDNRWGGKFPRGDADHFEKRDDL